MIELRWLSESGEKRLQYRWRELHTLQEQLIEASDWQDVPKVEVKSE